VHSMPVASHRIFAARWLDSTAGGSWMVIVFTMPVFLAYGIVFGAGAAYYANTLIALAVLAAIASALSAMMVMVGVMLVPATRMRSVVILLGVLLFVVLYLAIRLVRPEQLVNPEVFDFVAGLHLRAAGAGGTVFCRAPGPMTASRRAERLGRNQPLSPGPGRQLRRRHGVPSGPDRRCRLLQGFSKTQTAAARSSAAAA